MAYSATTILSETGSKLFDAGAGVWSEAVICQFVSEAQHLIALLRPDATATAATLALATASKQSLPTGGVRLLDVPMNTGGLPVQKISREKLTKLVPAWTTETGTALEFFMFDEESPTIFYVYPKPASAFNVEIVYSALPDTFTTSSTTLGISDIFIPAVYEYVLYRCFGMPTDGYDAAKSNGYLRSFYNMLGVKLQSDSILQQVQAND